MKVTKPLFRLMLSVLIAVPLSSCAAYEIKAQENNMQIQKNLIVPVQEMGSTAELDKLKFVDGFEEKNKDKILVLLKEQKKEIQQVNLQKISKWAVEEMEGYKIPDGFMDNLEVEGYYQSENSYGLFIKSIDLPSNNPLVKRFLYLIPVYDNTSNIFTVFVTIQGHVEE